MDKLIDSNDNQIITVREMLDYSVRIFWQNLLVILLITLVISIPINLFYGVLLDWLFASYGGTSVNVQDSFEVFLIFQKLSISDYHAWVEIIQALQHRVPQIIGLICKRLLGLICTLSVAYYIKMKLTSNAITYYRALKQGLIRWPIVLITNIMSIIVLFFLFLLFIVPGFIYAVYWKFRLYVVVLNNLSGREALSYSKSLVKGRWWLFFRYSVVFFILKVVFQIVISSPFWLLHVLQGYNILTVLLSGFIVDLNSAFFAVIFVILFLNFEATRVTQN